MSWRARFSGSARGPRKSPAHVGITPIETSGRPKRRLARRDDEVAGQHDLEAAPEGGALHGGDQGLAASPPYEAVLAAPGRDVVAARGQVAAGAEHLPGAGEDAHPQLVVVVELVERIVELVGHGAVDGVALRRPLHRDHEHVLVALSSDQRLGGLASSGHAFPRSPSLGTASRYRPAVTNRWAVRPVPSGAPGAPPPGGGRSGRAPRAKGQVPAMPTTGLLSGLPPIEP